MWAMYFIINVLKQLKTWEKMKFIIMLLGHFKSLECGHITSVFVLNMSECDIVFLFKSLAYIQKYYLIKHKFKVFLDDPVLINIQNAPCILSQEHP